jgi:hypothetical protein
MNLLQHLFLHLTAFLSAPLILIAQDLPLNDSFENWTQEEFFLEPNEWISNNHTLGGDGGSGDLFESVSRSTDAHEGDYAVRIINNSFTGEGPGGGSVIQSISVSSLSTIPDTLSLFYRCDSLGADGGEGMVVIMYLDDNGFMEADTIKITQETDEYSELKMAINPVISEASTFRIQLSAKPFHAEIQFLGHADLLFDAIDLGVTVGVEENESFESKWSTYPNPANSELNVDLSEISNSHQLIEIRLTDAQGKVVLKKNVEAGQVQQLDVSSFPPGFYQCTLMGKEAVLSTKKVLISR